MPPPSPRTPLQRPGGSGRVIHDTARRLIIEGQGAEGKKNGEEKGERMKGRKKGKRRKERK